MSKKYSLKSWRKPARFSEDRYRETLKRKGLNYSPFLKSKYVHKANNGGNNE